MRGSRYFLLGVTLAIAGGALAIDTAGYPVNPTFQKIKVTAVNGQPVLKYALANFTGFSGGCLVSSNSPIPANVSACSRTATGNYTVTISGFAQAPACFATEDAATGGPASLAVGTSSVQVTTFTAGGAALDVNFFLYCIGT